MGGRGMPRTKPENTVPAPSSLWFPGRKAKGFPTAPSSARAQEIAKGREELLGLLRDLPESDYELSLTDLVEKKSLVDGDVPEKTSAEEEASNRAAEAVKERRKRTRSSSGRRSSGDGVLLNMYVPTSLTRSLNGSRSRRGSSKGVTADCNKRDRESSMFGCWSAIWEKGRKTRRQ